jgi:hypothetical protein
MVVSMIGNIVLMIVIGTGDRLGTSAKISLTLLALLDFTCAGVMLATTNVAGRPV